MADTRRGEISNPSSESIIASPSGLGASCAARIAIAPHSSRTRRAMSLRLLETVRAPSTAARALARKAWSVAAKLPNLPRRRETPNVRHRQDLRLAVYIGAAYGPDLRVEAAQSMLWHVDAALARLTEAGPTGRLALAEAARTIAEVVGLLDDDGSTCTVFVVRSLAAA